MHRAAHLKKRFERQPDFQKEYTDFVNGMQSKGYMEKVPEDETNRDDGRLWYLPHHGVVHPKRRNSEWFSNAQLNLEVSA